MKIMNFQLQEVQMMYQRKVSIYNLIKIIKFRKKSPDKLKNIAAIVTCSI